MSKNSVLTSELVVDNKIVGSQFSSARWDEGFQNVRVEPLLLQCPEEEYIFSRTWVFSQDGRWLRGQAQKWETNPLGNKYISDEWLLVFYHIDSKYPQGISLPIFAGTTYRDNEGCFVNHSTLGPLYVDVGGGLLVYRLNQILEILRRK